MSYTSSYHVWVVTMLPEDNFSRHNADRVFQSLDGAKAWTAQRLRDLHCQPNGARWFDALGVVSNYTDAEGIRWASIARQEIVA
jgi:hypothetical protein